MSLERVQKILSRSGIASRRKAEELLRQGLVTINGKRAELGSKADVAKDHIKVEGKLINPHDSLAKPVYVLFYKPRGVLSAMKGKDGLPAFVFFSINE